MDAASQRMHNIAASNVTRYGTSSLSKAVAYQVNPIHAHHTGTKKAAKRNAPPKVGSSCKPFASAATATTKQRSKNNSSQVEVRFSSEGSRSTCGRNMRDRRLSGSLMPLAITEDLLLETFDPLYIRHVGRAPPERLVFQRRPPTAP